MKCQRLAVVPVSMKCQGLAVVPVSIKCQGLAVVPISINFQVTTSAGVETPEDGVSDAETCRGDIRLHLCTPIIGFIGVVNKKCNCR
jgi:hypothetical protein